MSDERVRQLGGLENRGDTVSDSWRASGQLPSIYMWGVGRGPRHYFPGEWAAHRPLPLLYLQIPREIHQVVQQQTLEAVQPAKQRRVRLLKRLLKRRAIQRNLRLVTRVTTQVAIQVQMHVPTQRAIQSSIRPDVHRDILRETQGTLRRAFRRALK